MLKKKLAEARDFLVKHSLIAYPLIVIFFVALTVVIALNAYNAKQKDIVEGSDSSAVESSQESTVAAEDVPFVSNESTEVEELINTYYTAMGAGDSETLRGLCDEIAENDLIYYEVLSEYIDHYSNVEIFTKDGPVENSVIAYVYFKMGIVNYEDVPGYETLYLCKNEEGKLYIKNENNFTGKEREYISTLNEQVDVVEFNNRVNVEYNEVMSANPELLEYLGLLGTEVKARVGVILAERNLDGEDPGETTDPGDDPGEGGTVVENPPVLEEKQYCTALATVNVRASDSEQADKLGKASKGQKLEVIEVRVNGWTKLYFEGKEAYIKSEFLKMDESASSYATIGQIIANTNINIRGAASQDSDRMGVLSAGEKLELIANEGEWCKIKYNGAVGYVKTEFVTIQEN